MKVKHYRTYICILTVFMSTVVHAEYDVSHLETLFTDKQQRAHIDAARSGKNINTGVRQTSKVSMNGYLTRSDGKSVVWLNDGNTLDGQRVGDVRVHSSSIGNNKKVTITVEGKSARLRPGETWHKETGKIVDKR